MGGGKVAGARGRAPATGTQSPERTARSRGGGAEGRTLGLDSAEARRAAWRRRSGARGWSCARWEASGAASGEALGAALEKAGSGGVATMCWRPPPHRPRPPCRGGDGKGREGKRGSCGERGLCRRSTPPPWPAAGKDREGYWARRIADPESNSGDSGRKENGKWQKQGHKVVQRSFRDPPDASQPAPTGRLGVPFELPGGLKVAEQSR